MIRVPPISVAAAAVLLSAAAHPATAQTFTLRPGFSLDSTKSATDALVPYGDLDLASSAGARTLLSRIEAAADAVCGGVASAVTDGQKADYRECRRMAVSGAVARARSPALTELASHRRPERRAAW